jgi:hypothetical protein
MMNTPLYCVQIARPNLCLAGVHRNDVPTVVAFRTVLQAQRARQVMWNETWRYDAWGQVIVMMPLKLARDQSTGMHLKAPTPSYGAASTSLGWMYAKSGEENTYTSHSPYLSINT